MRIFYFCRPRRKNLLIAIVVLFLAFPALHAAREKKEVKNVILFIGDGMGIAQVTLARWANGGAPLTMDEWTCGLVRTYGADTPLTDSAASASAYATGYKTENGCLSVMPEVARMWGVNPGNDVDLHNRPLVTLLEAARLQGKATGLVATCEISHATPAAFSAHYVDRDNYDAIIKQQVYNRIDVVLAGGRKYLQPSNRRDGLDMVKVLRENGYALPRTKTEMENATADKIWGLFADEDISYDIDRSPEEPSIEEMTRKAISVLRKNPRGFFLMVEGSKIDWAAHANEPIGVISDVLALDRAIKAAIDFARTDGRTAVIVVADHANGGLTLWDTDTPLARPDHPVALLARTLKSVTRTGEGMEKMIQKEKNADEATLDRLIREYFGLTLSPEELRSARAAILPDKDHPRLPFVLGSLMNRALHIKWSTTHHTGEEVALHVFHPHGYRPIGLVQNTAIARYIDEILGLDLVGWNRRLYLPAIPSFERRGCVVTIEAPASDNPILKVTRGALTLKFSGNTHTVEINGFPRELKTLVVFNGKGFFVSDEALNLMK